MVSILANVFKAKLTLQSATGIKKSGTLSARTAVTLDDWLLYLCWSSSILGLLCSWSFFSPQPVLLLQCSCIVNHTVLKTFPPLKPFKHLTENSVFPIVLADRPVSLSNSNLLLHLTSNMIIPLIGYSPAGQWCACL